MPDTENHVIIESLNSLTDTYSNVLKSYYGIGEYRLNTPEEIAFQHHLSVDKIELILKKSLNRLRTPRIGKAIIKFLDKESDGIWSLLSNAIQILYKNDVSNRANTLPGEISLAIDVVYSNLQTWLAKHAKETILAWYCTNYTDKEIEHTFKLVGKCRSSLRFPRPVEHLAQYLGVELDLLLFVTSLHRNFFAPYKGYLLYNSKKHENGSQQQGYGGRTVRAVRLHILLSEKEKTEIVPLRQLVDEYNSVYHDEVCLYRDLKLTVLQFPHLFLSYGKIGFCAIGDSNKTVTTKSDLFKKYPQLDDKDVNSCFYKKSGTEKKNINIVKDIFQQHGVLRRADLTNIFTQKIEDKASLSRSPATIISLMLINEGDFIQMAPSIFALSRRSGKQDDLLSASKLLLTKIDCRGYVLACHAGCPQTLFPAWTPDMEYKWCLWAERNRSKKLSSSLLAVVTPQSWPISDIQKEIWNFKKQGLGFYRIEHEFAEDALWKEKPSINNLFTATMYVKRFGYAGWIPLNLLFGSHLFARKGVTVIFLLVALKIVCPADDCQDIHHVGPEIDNYLPELYEHIHNRGIADWDDELGSILSRQLSEIDADKEIWGVKFQDIWCNWKYRPR